MPDLNDPETLGFYNELMLFKEDSQREALVFHAELSPAQRRIVHTIAHSMRLSHQSSGQGAQRQIHVHKTLRSSPPMAHPPSMHAGDPNRRGLNRAATVDFHEVRNSETGHHTVLRGQQSTGLLGIPDSPSGFGANSNLRSAKSVADLRSFTPSPVPSNNSYQQNAVNNISRYQDYASGSGSAGTPTLPTAPRGGFGQRGEDSLVNGFGSMSLQGLGNQSGESPRRLRSMFSWDLDNQGNPNGPASAGAIGSNRSVSVNTNHDNTSRDRGLPLRQPHGPSDRGGSAFSRGRQTGHRQQSSDEFRQSQQQGPHDTIHE